MSLTYFKADIESACSSRKLACQFKWLLLNHTLHLVLLIRAGQSLMKIPLLGKVFSFLFEYIIRILFSSDISLKARIGKGFVITHGHDIVIGADVVIGDNCRVFNGVTLGNKDIRLASKGNQPCLGRNVILSTGAKILGSICIGDDVIIGANSVVLKNCEPGGTYAGIPARKVG